MSETGSPDALEYLSKLLYEVPVELGTFQSEVVKDVVVKYTHPNAPPTLAQHLDYFTLVRNGVEHPKPEEVHAANELYLRILVAQKKLVPQEMVNVKF